MSGKPPIVEILQRTQTGEYCTGKEWDTKRLPATIRRILQERSLAGVCDPENPVNTDFELADEFYQAGYQAALELGFLCTDTDRIVAVSQDELDAAVDAAPSEVLVGDEKDGTLLKHRAIGDPYLMKVTASLAIAVTEDLFPLLLEGIAREREVDMLGGGSLLTIFGREILSGTPFETLAGFEHAKMHVAARKRAGRPGMGGINVYSAVTEYGQLGGYGVPQAHRSPTWLSSCTRRR